MTIQYKIAEKTSDMSSKTGSSREVIKKLINWGPYLQPHNRRSKLCTTM